MPNICLFLRPTSNERYSYAQHGQDIAATLVQDGPSALKKLKIWTKREGAIDLAYDGWAFHHIYIIQ